MRFTETISDVSTMMDGGDEEPDIESTQLAAKAAVGLMTLLQSAIMPNDWKKFETVSVDKCIGLEDLSEISGWLIEQYTDRPTESS